VTLRNPLAAASLSLFIAAALLLAACGSRAPAEPAAQTATGAAGQVSGAASATGRPFRIVASFYPMYIMVKNVAAGLEGIEVANLAGVQAGCLHDYSLTTADMKRIEGADVLVANGGGMESFIDRVASAYPNLPVVDSAAGISLIAGEAGPNPHVFVSIRGAEAQVANIARRLGEVDSSRAAAYRKNGEAYIARLEALAKRMHAAIDPLPNKRIVTFHEAFPYFAAEFGLEIVGVVEREPGSEPSAGELADTIALVKAKGVRALFAEPQYPPSSAETIARETGARVYVLDPAVTGPDDPGAYIAAMESNLAVLSEALR